MGEDIVYWVWVTSSLIGLVTEQSVYHWELEGEAPPAKIFDRHASLVGCQVIGYKVDGDGKWMVLIGISAQVY